MNALSNKAFLLYFISNTFALLGLWIQKIGVGWLTWEITGSTFWTSFVTLALMAPAGIIGPLFAVYAENWNMRTASIILKILMLLVGVIIWFLQFLDLHTLFSLAFLSIVQGLLSACYHPVRLVFVSVVVPRNLISSAVGLNSASFNGSRVIGPAFAGVSIALFSLESTFLIAVLAYIPLIPVLMYMPLRKREKSSDNNDKFFKRFIEGGKVALNTPIIVKGLFIVFISAFFVRGMLEIQPTIAGEILNQGSLGLSLITATAGLGALSASIWIGLRKNNNIKMETKLVLMLILGLIMSSIIGCISDMYLMALAFIIVGFSTTVVGIGTQTIIQMEVEDLYRARVLTWWSSISFGSLTVGGILLGFAGEYIPLNIGMIIMPILGFIIFKLVVKLHFKNNFI
ncbi:MFS transporter [Alphaproteobacteria bacterium]|jgi:MFS family permease|nr:MFS transporter [Alphaproteobacteria bacterium]